jgi:hypothetical protein
MQDGFGRTMKTMNRLAPSVTTGSVWDYEEYFVFTGNPSNPMPRPYCAVKTTGGGNG